MVNKVEPFSYQESTNIDEHNQIVDKVNEVVDVINDADLDNIPADIADAKATASQADTKADNAIAGLATKADKTALDSLTDTVGTKADKTALDALAGTVDTANGNIAKNTADIAGLSTKDIKSVEVIKPSPGKVQVRLTDNGNTPNDSNIMDLVIPTEYTIISGTTDRSFKIHIKMSDGSEIDTNDMVIPEGGGTDVSITSVTLTSPATNQIKVKVGLSDSSFIESQPLPVVTAVSGTVDGGNLTISVNGVTSAGIPIPSGGHDYTAGNGVKISEAYEISIDDAVVLTKAEAGTEYLSTQYNVTAKTITTDDTNLIVTDTREIGNVVGKIALSNLIKSVTGSVSGNNLTIGVNGVNSQPISIPISDPSFFMDSYTGDDGDTLYRYRLSYNCIMAGGFNIGSVYYNFMLANVAFMGDSGFAYGYINDTTNNKMASGLISQNSVSLVINAHDIVGNDFPSIKYDDIKGLRVVVFGTKIKSS